MDCPGGSSTLGVRLSLADGDGFGGAGPGLAMCGGSGIGQGHGASYQLATTIGQNNSLAPTALLSSLSLIR